MEDQNISGPVREFLNKNKKQTQSFLYQSRMTGFHFSIVNNLLFALLFIICRFVVQVNYDSFDLSKINNKIALFSNRRVCVHGDGTDKFTSMLSKINNIEVVKDNCNFNIELK